jgi:molybdenum cofactor cytidylyltransferase
VSVAAIILAAGRSTRFENGNKLLASVGGVAMVRRVALAIAASKADSVFIVVDDVAGDVAGAAGSGRWTLVANPIAAQGLATSLQAGLAALPTGATGALIALADMPCNSTDLVDRLIDAFDRSGARALVFPVDRDGRRGHPVIWPRSLFAELVGVQGDKGGREIIEKHAEICLPVSIDDPGAFVDIDKRADLDGLDLATLRRG